MIFCFCLVFTKYIPWDYIAMQSHGISAFTTKLQGKSRNSWWLEKKRLDEEKQEALAEKNNLAKENEQRRIIAREQKWKASEAALEALVQTRKRSRRMSLLQYGNIMIDWCT